MNTVMPPQSEVATDETHNLISADKVVGTAVYNRQGENLGSVYGLMLNKLTGKKPTKWMVVLMSLYLQGVATDEDVLRTLNKPDNRGIKLRAKAELWKKLGW